MANKVGASGFVCKATLLDTYLLTDKWIVKLGPPDKEAPNPHYRTAAPMKLWAVERVERFIDTCGDMQDFQMMQERRRDTLNTREERRANRDAKRRKEEERNGLELVAWARDCHIGLTRRLPKNLWEAARRSRDDHEAEIADWLGARAFSERPFDEQDIVNMIRHEYTNYHDILSLLEEEGARCDFASCEQAYHILKGRINALAEEIIAEGEQDGQGIQPSATK